MRFIKVTMIKTAAGPKFVLQAGKTYRLPEEDAIPLLDETQYGGKAAVRARSDAVVCKLPATPDPGDTVGKSEEVEEDEDE